MKRLLLVLILLLLSQLGWTQNTTNTPTPDYGTKLREYQQMERQGIINADLFYNIAVCHYRLGKSGLASRYLLMALNIDSDHKLSQENLEYIIDKSRDKALYPETAYLVKVFLNIYNFLNINRLSLITLILLLLLALCLHWFFHYPPDREKGLPILLLIICGFIFIATSALLMSKYKRMLNPQKGVVIVAETDALDGAGNEYNRLFSIHEALIVKIEQERPGWLLISLPNGIGGWVPAANIAIVSYPKR